MSEALPITQDEIARQAIDAAEAGAAIIHLHARNEADGRPSIDAADFERFLPRIKQSSKAVANISTGGSLSASTAERIAPALRYAPEMCSMNMGSMNFAFHPLADRYNAFKHEWEEDYIRSSEANIFRNTFADIAKAAHTLGEKGVKFEHECYDVGHLYNLKFCLDRGMFRVPIFIQFVMGILGGIGAEVDDLVYMKRTADRLFGSEYRWSVLGAGHAQMRLAAVAAQMGGNVRVGLEDSLHISRGTLAGSNAEQVAKIRAILEEQGNEVATADEAREMLDLKGSDHVNF